MAERTERATVIFVFGSNTRGVHGAQAALDARRFHGAINGQPYGLQGRSFAIPTCGKDYQPLPLDLIRADVEAFKKFAERFPALTFLVTRIGCGNAGYRDWEIAPMFEDAPLNCSLPAAWDAILNATP